MNGVLQPEEEGRVAPPGRGTENGKQKRGEGEEQGDIAERQTTMLWTTFLLLAIARLNGNVRFEN